jgi:hypothetical protein
LADLAVDVSMAAFHRAAAQWFEDPAQDVRSCVERAFSDLRVLAAGLDVGLGGTAATALGPAARVPRCRGRGRSV